MSSTIKVTTSASAYIKKWIANQPHMHFRLSIKKTGCSGYRYFPSLVEQVTEQDIRLEVDKELTVWIDSSWLSMLEGLQIDYIEEEKSGLKQKRLVFHNPKESSRCGCGESFHVE